MSDQPNEDSGDLSPEDKIITWPLYEWSHELNNPFYIPPMSQAQQQSFDEMMKKALDDIAVYLERLTTTPNTPTE